MLGFIDKLHAANVSRWHMVRTSKSQSVAEHTFLVQVIAIEIMRRIKAESDFLDEDNWRNQLSDVMMYSLHHDLPEVAMGDIPTHTKELLEAVTSGIMEKVERSICKETHELAQGCSEFSKKVVKCADLIEAISFISREGMCKKSEYAKEYLHKKFCEYTKRLRSDGYFAVAKASEGVFDECMGA
jgi:5'-deoxynucleotidase